MRTPTGLKATPRAASLGPALEEVLLRADPSTAERTLPGLLQRLAREAPGVKLRLAVLPSPRETALERGELDVVDPADDDAARRWSAPRPPPWSGCATSCAASTCFELTGDGSPIALSSEERGAMLRRTLNLRALSDRPVWSRLFDETFEFVVRLLRRGPFTLERFLALRHLAIARAGRSNRNAIDELLTRLGKKREVVATVPSFLVVPSLLVNSHVGVRGGSSRRRPHGTTPSRCRCRSRRRVLDAPGVARARAEGPRAGVVPAVGGRRRTSGEQRHSCAQTTRGGVTARSFPEVEGGLVDLRPAHTLVPLGLRDGELTLRDGRASRSSTPRGSRGRTRG